MGKAFHSHSGGGSSSGWLVCHFLWERTHPDVQLGAANHDTPQAPRVLLGREHDLHRNLESRVDVQPLNLHRAALGGMSRWRGDRSIAAIDVGTSTMTITSATTGAIISSDARARMVCHLRPFSKFKKCNLQRIPREFRDSADVLHLTSGLPSKTHLVTSMMTPSLVTSTFASHRGLTHTLRNCSSCTCDGYFAGITCQPQKLLGNAALERGRLATAMFCQYHAGSVV